MNLTGGDKGASESDIARGGGKDASKLDEALAGARMLLCCICTDSEDSWSILVLWWR